MAEDLQDSWSKGWELYNHQAACLPFYKIKIKSWDGAAFHIHDLNSEDSKDAKMQNRPHSHPGNPKHA